MFTGLQAEEHQLFGTDASLEGRQTVWQDFREAGYSTGVFSKNPFITEPVYGLTDGFDTVTKHVNAYSWPVEGPTPISTDVLGTDRNLKVEYLRETLRSENPVGGIINGISYYLRKSTPAPDSVLPSHPRVTDWISAQDGEWAACINLMTTHMDYEPQQEFDLWGSAETWEMQNRLEDQRWSFYSGNRPWSEKEQLVDLYDGTIREVDARIEFLYRWLESQGLLEDTLLIVTGDHGECFGEYSTPRPGIRLSDHTIGIHDRQLHVPLFVRPPGTRKEVVTKPVSLTGLYDMLASVVEDDMSVERLHERTPVAAVDMHRRIKYGGDDSMELIDRYGIDIDQFKGFARAMYTEETKRYAHWGNDTEPAEIPTAVWEAMTGYEDQQVAVKADVNSETKERLKKLGYL